MALHIHLTVVLFFLLVSRIQLSTSQALKSKLSCLDCNIHYDFSGIKVLVKCDKMKKLSMATTNKDGSFQVELPSDTSKAHTFPLNCVAKLFGGPKQLYSSSKDVASKVVQTQDTRFYTISSPLGFFTQCPSTLDKEKCRNIFGSSKTFNLPVPPEWGIAPTSYYVPFFPIIGIP